MGRAARILVATAVATAIATAWSQAPTPRMNLGGFTEPLPVKAPPSTPVNFTFVGPDGRDASFQARTDPFGNLPIGGYVPWNEWTAARAVRGGNIVLPDQGYGSMQVGGPAATPQPLATWNGALVDPARYTYNVLEPFSLFCRAAEGPPQSLAVDDRYAFEVPNTSALQAVLAQPYVTNPSYFALPGGQGFSVSVAPRSDPQATWNALQGLAQKGTITGLERDPCMQFLPQGQTACTPGAIPFPDKAARIGTSVGGVLRGPGKGMPIGGASILVGPLSPTPFANPGPRPGDAQPPTIATTGGDGGYNVPLGTMAGPVEIGVAKGCDDHTTVAVAGTPQTVAKPPPTPVVAPPTFPQPMPQPNEKVCGPDVTAFLLGNLQFMIETFSQWSAVQQQANCDYLYGSQFDGAWDQVHFTPYDGNRGDENPMWFGRYFPGVCAIPKSPCGATVEFLGQCLDAQIVNYVQWGAINQLCGTQERGRFAHLMRDVALGALEVRAPWSESPTYEAQNEMSMVGEQWASGSGNLTQRKEAMERFVRRWTDLTPSIRKLKDFECALTCGVYVPPAERDKKLGGYTWGFKWGPDWYNRQGDALPKP